MTEPLAKMPAHRILAMFRGEKEGVLDLNFEPEDPAQAPASGPSMYEQRIARKFNIVDRGRPADKWLNDTVRWAWRTRVQGHLAVDLRMRLWQAAEEEAVRVFASNLRDLLLAAPAGTRATLGLDPGFRTGVKVAVVDATGKVAATTAIYPHEPKKQWTELLAILGRLLQGAQGRADRHRQRHCLARNRQAGLRAYRAGPRVEAHENRGVGSGRLGLFRERLCQRGTARA